MKNKTLNTLNNLDNIHRAFENLAMLSCDSDYSEAKQVGSIAYVLSESLELELEKLHKQLKKHNNCRNKTI